MRNMNNIFRSYRPNNKKYKLGTKVKKSRRRLKTTRISLEYEGKFCRRLQG